LNFTYIIQFFLVIGLLFLSAFFSGSETAFFSLTKAKLKQVQKENPYLYHLLSTLLKEPRRLITTILIGNELVNVAATATAASLLISLIGNAGTGVTIAVMSLLLLVWGEITPKTFAVYNPVRFVKVVAPPMHMLWRIVFPLVKLLQILTDRISPQPATTEPKVTEEEFKTLVQVSQEEGILEKEEKEMIEKVMEFTDTSVREIMVPGEEIFALPIHLSISRAKSQIKRNLHSRVPVYKESLDNIQGILFTKDLLISSRKKKQAPSLSRLLKPTYFTAQDTLVIDLLREFQTRKVHLAVVIDPQGKTVGLVTLDDLMEEIFGELEEKEHVAERLFVPLSGKTFKVSGKMNVEDFNQTLRCHIDAGDYETIGGFLFGLFGEKLRKGARRQCQNLEFRIRKIRKNQVREFTVRKIRGSTKSGKNSNKNSTKNKVGK
jgi:CBS domain containing-hemolysin-like protein